MDPYGNYKVHIIMVEKMCFKFSDYNVLGYLWFEIGLFRTSTSSPSWIFEALVPVPKVVADVSVFVHDLRGW